MRSLFHIFPFDFLDYLQPIFVEDMDGVPRCLLIQQYFKAIRPQFNRLPEDNPFGHSSQLIYLREHSGPK
jgi:hypothetical protein